jgi:putative endonuclease
MSAARQAMGIRGERVAEKWLRVHGWDIAERRFKNGHRDIDLVAIRRESDGSARTVAFVEVKTRKNPDFGGPVAQVGWRKQRELRRSAQVWMSRFQVPGDTFRFDVIGVILSTTHVRVQHVENAFLVTGLPPYTLKSSAVNDGAKKSGKRSPMRREKGIESKNPSLKSIA